MDWARLLVSLFPHYLNEFIPFPGFPGLPEKQPDINKIPEFLNRIKNRSFDLAIQMHGNGSLTNSILFLLGAKINAGFYIGKKPDLNTSTFFPYPENEHEIQRNLKLLEYLDIPSRGNHLEFPITEKDKKDFDRIRSTFSILNSQYVCIHPGARSKFRRWPLENFENLSNILISRGYSIVFTSSKEETNLTETLKKRVFSSTLDLGGKTSLGVLVLILKNASFLVTNDTGISHIATALSVPSVTLITCSDPNRYAPLDTEIHKAVFYPLDCRPCNPEACHFNFVCIHNLSIQMVLKTIDALMPVIKQRSTTGVKFHEQLQKNRITVRKTHSHSNITRSLNILTWPIHGNYMFYLSHIPHNFFLPVKREKHGNYGGKGNGFP